MAIICKRRSRELPYKSNTVNFFKSKFSYQAMDLLIYLRIKLVTVYIFIHYTKIVPWRHYQWQVCGWWVINSVDNGRLESVNGLQYENLSQLFQFLFFFFIYMYLMLFDFLVSYFMWPSIFVLFFRLNLSKSE